MPGVFILRLASRAAEHFVLAQEQLPAPSVVPQELRQQRACYVTVIERPGKRVRSLFGTPLPSQPNLAQEIIYNTVRALENVPRRLRRADLRDISFEVAVLGPLERIGGREHLDPARFGLYVRSDRGKTAVLLPQRTGIETPDDQLATALREAEVNLRQEAVTLYRFPVSYIGP